MVVEVILSMKVCKAMSSVHPRSLGTQLEVQIGELVHMLLFHALYSFFALSCTSHNTNLNVLSIFRPDSLKKIL